MDKSICITDCLSLDLSAAVLHTDNVWNAAVNNTNQSSGWNSYYLEAALPINVGRCATLTPYIGYNGTPDGWVGDGVVGYTDGGNQNENDVFLGGVRFNFQF